MPLKKMRYICGTPNAPEIGKIRVNKSRKLLKGTLNPNVSHQYAKRIFCDSLGRIKSLPWGFHLINDLIPLY